MDCAGPPENFVIVAACTGIGQTIWAALVALGLGGLVLLLANEIEQDIREWKRRKKRVN